MRDYEVRHLLNEDRTIEDVVSWVKARCEGVAVQPQVNVLELLAPMETHLRVERALEEMRQAVREAILAIYPIADLVTTQEMIDEDATSPDWAGFTQVESVALFKADELREVIRLTIPGTFTIREQGRNLVVFGEPAVQRHIAEYFDELRKNVAEAQGEHPPPPSPVD